MLSGWFGASKLPNASQYLPMLKIAVFVIKKACRGRRVSTWVIDLDTYLKVAGLSCCMLLMKEDKCSVQDNVVALADVVPSLQGLSGEALKEIAEQALIPLQVDSDRQYYISLRHGILIDKARLFEILKGEYRN